MSNTPDILKNPLTNKGTAFTLEERPVWTDRPAAGGRGDAGAAGRARLPPVLRL